MDKKNINTIQIHYYSSPCGELILGSFEGKLCLCDWMNENRRVIIDKRLQHTLHADYQTGNCNLLTKAIVRLDEYFSGERTTFDIPLLFAGTDFQKAVWNELLNIPYGTTITYGNLAQRLGNPRAVRAVAACNGANPISIFVPCHRVIGSNHKLTGYGGGLEAKRFLIRLESPTAPLFTNSY